MFVPPFLLLLSESESSFLLCAATDVNVAVVFQVFPPSQVFSWHQHQTHLDVTSPVTSGTILKVGGVRATFIFVSLTVNLFIFLLAARETQRTT